MVILLCRMQLYLPGTRSLKEKRGRLKPLLHQLRRRFQIAAAEVGEHDLWQRAEVALVAVSTEDGPLYALLERAVHWTESYAPQVEVLDWQMELR